MRKYFKRSVWTLLTIFFAIIFVIMIVVGNMVKPHITWIDSYFGAIRNHLVNDENADKDDAQYYVSQFAKKDENGNLILTTDDNNIKHQVFDNEAMRKNSLDVAERVAEEGSVLLWNNNDALPLSEGNRVSVFGVNSVNWQYIGLGSGHVNITNPTKLQDALTSRKLETNTKLFALMEKFRNEEGYGCFRYSVNSYAKEIPWKRIDGGTRGGIAQGVSQFSDAAIYTIGRISGEEFDTDLLSEYASHDGKYLSFTNEELGTLQGLKELKEAGKIKKVILVLNCPQAMPIEQITDYGIDACLWVGYGGNVSTEAVADLLVGNANPSGHLTDTWAYNLYSSPSTENFGDYTFTKSNGIPANDEKTVNDKYVVYQEGIYVGYLYYETRYEDLVIGGRNADATVGVKAGDGKWDYNKEVAYTFGHGESYTDFEYSNYSVEKKGDNYEVSMTIKNVGGRAGKEVMQVYLQKPYTDYDREKGIEKAAVQLVGFAKTKLLEPNEPQTLTVIVPEYEFKCYDSYGEGTYILEAGDYYLAAGTNAHDALNNILAKKDYTKANGMDADGDADFAEKINIAKDDFEKYSISPFTKKPVTNQFNDVDVNLYEGTKGQEITYLSRSNWKDTYPSAVTLTCESEIMAKDMQYGRDVPNNSEDEFPVYGMDTSEYGHLNLIQLRGVPYDDPLWEDLLNQTTFKQQVDLMRSSLPALKGISAPGGGGIDGCCGVNGMHAEGLNSDMGFPCNPIVGSTFNVELIEEMGKAFGLELMHIGTNSGIWGSGANIHRNVFGGRQWEYYSEDGFLSGEMNAAETKGLKSQGVVVFTKHFALNEQETNRYGVTVWANEQSIREVYLKAFESGITEAKGNGMMTSYSRIGCTWTGIHYGLLTGVLRNEWGFTGSTVTDYPLAKHMGSGDITSIYPTGILAGQEMWLTNTVLDNMNSYETNPTVCKALREATHRILYTQLYSFSMNGITSKTRVVEVMPAWECALIGIEIASGILAVLCLGMTAASWVFWYRDEKKYE